MTSGLLAAGASAVVLAGLLYFLGYALVWTLFSAAGLVAPAPESEWDLADVQARVVTVGDTPSVVQRTVDALPEGLGSAFVVSETPLDVDGAEVRVVDPSFTCEARGKARALEWARRTLPCDEEYVLLLDEDTVVDGLEGLPDADVVQFAEKPQRNRSLLAWLTEVYRVGNGVERAGFAGLVPLYAWGGGLAVRKRVEDEIGWNRDTIVEDSVFVRDAVSAGHSYAVVMTRFENQAPGGLRELVEQRRRWASGRFRDAKRRPLPYALLLYFHTLGRPMTAVALPLAVAGYLLSPVSAALPVLATVAVAYLLLWSVVGWAQYGRSPSVLLALVLALPVTTVANGAGDLYALLSPVSEFRITEKADVESAATPRGQDD